MSDTRTHQEDLHANAPHPGATRARQGSLGRPVVWVLLISTVLAAIALFVAWGQKAPDMAATEPPSIAQQDTAHFDAPPPAPRQTPAQEPAPAQ